MVVMEEDLHSSFKRRSSLFLQHQLKKPYYHPYIDITQPMWNGESESMSV